MGVRVSNLDMDTKSVPPDALNPHQYNVRLFRQRTPSERFIRDIEEKMEEPIIVNEQNEIIDGTRRWLAACEAELDSVDVIERSYDSVEEEKLAILRHNDDRDETFSQKMRVALEYEETIAPILEDRMTAGVKLAEQEDDPLLDLTEGNVRARDLAADRINWSGSKYNQAKQVWKAAHGEDEVAQSVRERARELIREIEDPEENTSVYAAYQRLKREQERQKLPDPVRWETLREVGWDEPFERADETFEETRNQLDSSRDWPDLHDSLRSEYQQMWGQGPDPGTTHILVYRLEQSGLADLSQDEWAAVDPVVERKPDRDELFELYWEEDLNITGVAILYGVREEVVEYWLREEDIDRKKRELPKDIRQQIEEQQ